MPLKLGWLVVGLCLGTPALASAQFTYQPCEKSGNFACQTLQRPAEPRLVLVVDKNRADGARPIIDPRTGLLTPQANLWLINLKTGEKTQWVVGLGCESGRKARQGDNRTPEGVFELVELRIRNQPWDNRSEDWVTLGAYFFLTSYPTAEDCVDFQTHKECRQKKGDLVGLHGGRKTARCTNGCIRLTGPDGSEDSLMAALVAKVDGDVVPLLVGRLHDSFNAQPTADKCWLQRFKELSRSRDHERVLAELLRPCIETLSPTPPQQAELEFLPPRLVRWRGVRGFQSQLVVTWGGSQRSVYSLANDSGVIAVDVNEGQLMFVETLVGDNWSKNSKELKVIK